MAVSGNQLACRVGFGLYEADLQTGELWKAGRKIRLQSQPFKVLAALLEHPGEVVSRGELQGRLWGRDAVGDFDQSLGTAVNKIRDALGDTADNPRFVETLAKRGYRFIAPVHPLLPVPESSHEAGHGTGTAETPLTPLTPQTRSAEATRTSPEEERARTEPLPATTPVTPDVMLPAASVPAAAPVPVYPVPAERPKRNGAVGSWSIHTATALLSAFAIGLAVAWVLVSRMQTRGVSPLLRIDKLTHSGNIAPGMPGMESLPASAGDGLRIFVPVLENGRSVLSRVDVHTGAVQPIDLPHEVASPMLGNLSPDLSTLLLRSHLSPESEQPLWRAPVGGGSALRIPNIVAHDATWMPDGKNILYAVGDRLLIDRPEDGGSTPFATLPGRALWMRWSPDGNLLRFTLLDPLRHTMGLWQIDSAGKHLQRLLDGWDRPSSECCGVWADEGKYFVFQATRGDHTDLWRLDRNATSSPVQLTDGPLNFAAPVSSSHSSRIQFLGLDTRSVLQKYDATLGHFVPVESFLADASRLEYSRDGKSVVWVDLSGRAWRSQADGSERIQLAPDSLQVFLARWSPDGQQIALMARESGNAWQLYLVPSEGGTLRHLDTGSRNAADPSWSANGKQLVFGRVNDEMGNEGAPRSLETLDVETGARAPVPGSTDLFSPRWSPDGRYIAALSLDQHQVLLFNVMTKHWETIARTTAADPVWSDDSTALYFHAALAELQPIYRVSIPDGHLQQVANLFSFSSTPTDYFFSGLSANGSPMLRSRTATGDLYTLDLEQGKETGQSR